MESKTMNEKNTESKPMNEKNPIAQANANWDKYTAKRNNLIESKRGEAKVKIIFMANQWLWVSKKKQNTTFPTNKQFAEFANCSIRWVKRVFKQTGLKHFWRAFTRIKGKAVYKLRAVTGNVTSIIDTNKDYVFKKVHSKNTSKVADQINESENNELNNLDYVYDSVFDIMD